MEIGRTPSDDFVRGVMKENAIIEGRRGTQFTGDQISEIELHKNGLHFVVELKSGHFVRCLVGYNEDEDTLLIHGNTYGHGKGLFARTVYDMRSLFPPYKHKTY